MIRAAFLLAVVGCALVASEPSGSQFIYRPSAAVSCTTTLTSGGNVNTAITNAAGGDVICLDAGNYTVNTSATKSSTVTVKSTTGVSATVTQLTINGATHLTFDSLTIHSLDLDGDATDHVTISNSVQQASSLTSYWEVNCRDWTGSTTIVFDGNTHTSTSDAGTVGELEGRFSFSGGGGVSGNRANCGGVQVKNSTFSGVSNTYCSDGIFLQAGNVHIGPGNHFATMLQGSCGAHVDSIQCFDCEAGIVVEGNYFESSSVSLGWYDGFDGVDTLGFDIYNNVFVDGSLQVGGFTNLQMYHNTFYTTTINTASKSGGIQSEWVFENNLLDSSSALAEGGSPVQCGAQCVTRYNLKSGGSTTYRDDGNNVTGTAVYIGSRSFANWANWLLAGGSPGKAAGNDSQDMGTNYYGS